MAQQFLNDFRERALDYRPSSILKVVAMGFLKSKGKEQSTTTR